MNESEDEYYDQLDIPAEYLKISATSWRAIYLYSGIFVVSCLANFYVLVSVCRVLKKRPSPMNKLLLHLCLADILVIFGVIPVEIGWRITIGWYAGNIMCKVVQSFRVFGLYLSSLILICISLDRYWVVVHPLRAMKSSQRTKTMLIISWILAALCSIPQGLIFGVETHPRYKSFSQCFSGVFGELAEIANTIFSLVVIYFLPLAVIIFSYTWIILRIFRESSRGTSRSQKKRSRNSDNKMSSEMMLRRNGSGPSNIERARIQTIKLTMVIVIVFLVCWTPYVTITLWHVLDPDSARNIDPAVQEILFIMAVANSMMDPLVYGLFSRKKSSSNPSGNGASVAATTFRNSTYSRVLHSHVITERTCDTQLTL